MNSPSTKRVLLRRSVLSWALYDCANSAFATTVIAGFFPVYYNILTADMDVQDSQFWFNLTLAASSALIAIAAPLLGAISDHHGSRKKFLATFAMIGIIMSASLAWVHAGMWWVGLLLYGFGSIGFSGANIFYDSMLVGVADESEYDLVSAYGFALGYIGGGLLFTINVLMVTQPSWFGFADASSALAAAFISVAVWWGVFSIPLLWSVKESAPKDQTQHHSTISETMRYGLAQLLRTFKELRRMKILLIFLIAYWFYIDGVNTIIKMAVFFGERVLSLPRESLITALLITQFVAFPAALFFGWLGNKIGPKRGILIGLVVYLSVVIYAWRWLTTSFDFYLLAIAIGLVQGGVQSLSRSLYARLIPHQRSAEFFGLFNMVGKFAAILGPLLMALVPVVFSGAAARDSILPLLLLFAIGGGLLWKVNVADGMRDAQQSNPPLH